MTQPAKYLIDTNIISELRKNSKANPGVLQFLQQAAEQATPLYLSVITIGELRRGVELIRHRGGLAERAPSAAHQADLLETWLQMVLEDYADHILDFTALDAQVWGKLRVPHPQNALDKMIAATALTCGLTLVTRNVSDFTGTGVPLLNPFKTVDAC
jgi:predicted nucleic acid-binding protein